MAPRNNETNVQMETLIDEEFITCGKCSYQFERSKANKHCSNCIVCTGCEVYYCAGCDEEIIITPIKPIYNGSGRRAQSSGQEEEFYGTLP